MTARRLNYLRKSVPTYDVVDVSYNYGWFPGRMNRTGLPERACVMRGVFFAVLLVGSSGFVLAEEIVPLPPCRVLDTRNVSLGYRLAGTTMDFAVRNGPSSPGAAQGGEAGCGIPYNATAVFLNIVAIAPAGTGHALIWANGATQPTASALNVVSGETTNGAVLAALQPYGPATDLKLKNVLFNSYWVIDVMGYTEPSHAALVGQGVGTLYGTTLVIETLDGAQIRATVPDRPQLADFRDSWIASIAGGVGECVLVEGLWFDDGTTVSLDTFEARSLPIITEGYCGPTAH